MSISDMFRPAMFVSIGVYAKPENRVRALSLIRLSINMGFAAGPALGGLIILGLGYQGLFWVDGSTCIIAILLFSYFVMEKKKMDMKEDVLESNDKNKTVFQDKPYWVFLFISFTTAMLFFQIFTVLPLFHSQQFGLSEVETGLLISLNGFLIFMFEMPLVSFLERKQFDRMKIIFWGALLMAISYYILLFDSWSGILVVAMVLFTLSEILSFPFSNAIAIGRAPKGQEGRYMALYTMSFSLAHIVSSKLGLEVIGHYGYSANWLVMGTFGIVAMFVSIGFKRMVTKENQATQ